MLVSGSVGHQRTLVMSSSASYHPAREVKQLHWDFGKPSRADLDDALSMRKLIRPTDWEPGIVLGVRFSYYGP